MIRDVTLTPTGGVQLPVVFSSGAAYAPASCAPSMLCVVAGMPAVSCVPARHVCTVRVGNSMAGSGSAPRRERDDFWGIELVEGISMVVGYLLDILLPSEGSPSRFFTVLA